MRWLLILIAAPVFFVVALAQNIQTKPVPALPTGPITVGTAPQQGSSPLTGELPAGLTPEGVPANQWPLIVAAAQASGCGVSPSDLAAIARIESGFGSNNGPNPVSGAFGYGQFMPGTFAAEGGTGNPSNPADALPVMARMLCEKGYGSNRVAALNSYGGCVTANCLGPGKGDYATAITNLAQGFLPKVPDVVATALQWLGTPYAWGGNVPGIGLDCSGLVQQAFLAAGIRLPRTSELQYAVTQRIGADQVRAGDLVFFSSDGPGATHVGIIVRPGEMVDAPDVGLTVRTESYLTAYWESVLFGFGRVG